MTSDIGTLKETSLHASLKQLYARKGDLIEERVGNWVVDIVRGDTLIEIHTGNFGALKPKLDWCLDQYCIRIIYPLMINRKILRIANNYNNISKRNSPKHGHIEDIFLELVYIPQYLNHENFSLEVVLFEEELVLINDGKGSWRRGKWSIFDRRLVNILGKRTFEKPDDYYYLLPQDLGDHFTSRDLCTKGVSKRLVGKMLYTLCAIGKIRKIGKQGRYFLYEREQQYQATL